jgi:peptidoglycan/LPS O-acetylase OafA/YrhL
MAPTEGSARQGAITPGGAGEKIVQAGETRSARVESLRALAAVAVVIAHTWGYAHAYQSAGTQGTFLARLIFGGGFGVYLFFALSGYLIYWPFARRDFGGSPGIDLRRYAANRMLRILPLYWLAVIVVLAFQSSPVMFADWWHWMLFAENYVSLSGVDGPLWSVVVELQFYVLLPLLALGIASAARGSRVRGAAAIGALGLASFLPWWLLVHQHGGSYLWRYNLPTTFFFFTGGMLVAVLRTAWTEQRPSWLRGALASSDMWLLASLPLWLAVIWRYDNSFLLAVASALMVAACVLPLRPGLLTRCLEWRPLALVGVASYSLYVWHVPILRALTGPAYHPANWIPSGFLGLALVAVPVSLAVAFVSFRFVETPFLRLRRRWSPASAKTDASPPGLEPKTAEAPVAS